MCKSIYFLPVATVECVVLYFYCCLYLLIFTCKWEIHSLIKVLDILPKLNEQIFTSTQVTPQTLYILKTGKSTSRV